MYVSTCKTVDLGVTKNSFKKTSSESYVYRLPVISVFTTLSNVNTISLQKMRYTTCSCIL